MLIIERSVGETIQVGADIVIMLVRVSRKTARIGIKAPRDVIVRRSELKEKEVSSNESRGVPGIS